MDCPTHPQYETANSDRPISTVFISVFNTASVSTDPILSKNGLIGMKYPASKMMGGKRYMKKMLASRTYSDVEATLEKCRMAPRMRPRTMRRQLSGTVAGSLWYRWNPRKSKKTCIINNSSYLKIHFNYNLHTCTYRYQHIITLYVLI